MEEFGFNWAMCLIVQFLCIAILAFALLAGIAKIVNMYRNRDRIKIDPKVFKN